MKVVKPMTHQVRNKVEMYIKNQMDISDLIADYNIKDMNLTGAIIKTFNRQDQDISNTLFVRAIIGEEGKTNSVNGCNFRGSNFMGAKFLGKMFMRYCDLRDCNFNDAWLPDLDYRYSDLTNITLCEAVFRVGSRNGYKSKFQWSQFEKLARYLELDMGEGTENERN